MPPMKLPMAPPNPRARCRCPEGPNANARPPLHLLQPRELLSGWRPGPDAGATPFRPTSMNCEMPPDAWTGWGPPLKQFVRPLEGAHPRAPPGVGTRTTSSPGTGSVSNPYQVVVLIPRGLLFPTRLGGRLRRPPSMCQRHVERGPGAGNSAPSPAMPAVPPEKNPSRHRHKCAVDSYSTLTLSWMNTGRDKREVRERDRQRTRQR